MKAPFDFVIEPKGNRYNNTKKVGDKKFSDKPMYEGQKPSTHLMAYGESDGKYVAYPTLFQNDDGMWYQPDDAFREAIKTKEIYQFNTEEEAAEFAGPNASWKDK